MPDPDDFLDTMLPGLVEAEKALHNGDPRARTRMWSRTEPLTLFGAWVSARGWMAIERVFERLGERFSQCTSYESEILSAGSSGDLAYTVALEHTTASVNGSARAYTLRVTTLFRRENGVWKVFHRHGDELTEDTS